MYGTFAVGKDVYPESLQRRLDPDEKNDDRDRPARAVGTRTGRCRAQHYNTEGRSLHRMMHQSSWSGDRCFNFLPVVLMGCLLLYPFQSLAANIDVELRVGAETVCFTCPDNTFPWKTHPTGQLFTDLLFPVPSFESLEFGPYIKLAGVEDIFQAAGGIAAGVFFSRWEALINAGLAYSGRRIGTIQAANGEVHPGQSQGTYDLGASLRFFFSETKKKWYASFQYTHNSNGEKLGLNWLSDKTTNPGIDALTVGLGYRF